MLKVHLYAGLFTSWGERRETANREIITTFFFKKRRLKANFKTKKVEAIINKVGPFEKKV